MQKKLLSGIGLLIIGVIVLAANFFGALIFRGVHFDMTEENLYTLSKGSVNIVRSLDADVRAKVFYSKRALTDIPPLKAYADRVVAMLRQYEQASKGKLSVEVLEPRPDDEIEEAAIRYGLQAVPGQSGERFFLGMVLLDDTGQEVAYPFFHPDREPTLEYDVSKALYKIGNPEKKRIGVLSSLPVLGAAAPPMNPMMQQQPPPQQPAWVLLRELRNNFETIEVDSDAVALPQDLDLLLIIHPKNLSNATQYAIDQYVLAGGKALVFVDPFCFTDSQSVPREQMQMRMQMSFNSGMPKLLKAWGIELAATAEAGGSPGFGGAANQIVADPDLALQMPTARGPQDLIVLLGLRKDNCNSDEIITNELENLTMVFAGALQKTTTSDAIEVTPLLTTSESASTVGDTMLKFGGIDPEQFRKDYQPGSSALMLACKITGSFKTAFPAGMPAPEAGPGEEAAKPTRNPDHLSESATPATVIVVADVDMLSDQHAVRIQNFLGQQMISAINDNIHFLTNAADNLTGSEDLIALRSRGRSQRPFTKVLELRREAQEQWLEEERRLTAKQEEANKRLTELQGKGRILDQAVMAELKTLREESAKTGRQLREVKRHLREDIERLGLIVKFLNIAVLPVALVVALGLIVAGLKSRRRRVSQ